MAKKKAKIRNQPRASSDNQGLRMVLEVEIPQEHIEEIAKAIAVEDLMPALVKVLANDPEKSADILTALLSVMESEDQRRVIGSWAKMIRSVG